MTAATESPAGGGGSPATFEYRLPSLGADMDVGRVVEWKVAIGDEVHRGDVMAVVETEKSDIDIEIWHDGVVTELLVPLGEELPVGTPIAVLRPLDGAAGDAPVPADVVPTGAAAPGPSSEEEPVDAAPDDDGSVASWFAGPAESVKPQPSGAPTRVAASPLARRLAEERGVDLAAVVGTGPGGAVVRSDVEAHEVTPPREAAVRKPVSSADSMRALIAERMTTANREIPHYFLAQDVDVSPVLEWLTKRNEDRPIAERVLPAALYLKAVALAAAAHPELNGFWVDGGFRPGEAVNVAMAVSLRRGGLVTPNVADADERTVDEIMAQLREFVAAARTGTLRGSWMTGATITLTNLGDKGSDLVHGVINPPQVALVGMGAARDRPWVVDGELAVRPVMTVTLAADHRATDGVTGARMLTAIAHALADPEGL